MALETYTHKSLCAKCQKPGTSACAGCRLVTYCSKQCQTEHWKAHRADCKSPLRAESWLPQWAVEQREYNGCTVRQTLQQAALRKYLWGNLPALDVLRLRENEGENYSSDAKLLFAASGDPRNVLKTLADLPHTYNGRLSCTINDRDPLVVARNAIILLLLATVEDSEEVSECILHLWYSAFIRQADLDLISRHILPLVHDVCGKIEAKATRSLHSKTWRIRNCSVRLILDKEAWQTLLSCFKVRSGLTLQRAQAVRHATVNHCRGQDDHDSIAIRQIPIHRVCRERYFEDGVVLPFGHSREAFVVPNPTLFQAADWPFDLGDEPASGWDRAQILRTPCGNATNDFTGQLYCHIRSTIWSSHRYLLRKGANFELFNVNADKLSQLLPKSTFARVEVSNLTDGYYLGTDRVASSLGSLLEKRTTNPHATLLTAYMNAVHEMHETLEHHSEAFKEKHRRLGSPKLLEYDRMARLCQSSFVAKPVISRALGYMQDHESRFAEYCKILNFSSTALKNRLRVKTQNTVVAKWPFALKLKKGEAAFDEEFNVLFASANWGRETYVEWASTD